MTAAPWKFGDPPTEEMKAKSRATRAAKAEARKAGKPAKPKAARPHKPRVEAAPVRTGGPVTAAVRRKVITLVARMVKVTEGTALWTMQRIERPQYQTDPATNEIMVDPEGRPIIIGKVRAVSDATIAADRLEDWEIDWLSQELTDELLKYKKIRTFLLKLVEIEERSSLPMCVTILALPRLVRHGILPTEFTGMVNEMRDAARKARHAPRAVPAPEPEPAPEVPLTRADAA